MGLLLWERKDIRVQGDVDEEVKEVGGEDSEVEEYQIR